MNQYHTAFGSLRNYEKGSIEIVNDNPKHYVFSNVFEVAAKSAAYEKVVVAVNMEYTIEVLRAEGQSPWFANAHDETAVVMDGLVRVELRKLRPESHVPAGHQGAVRLEGDPEGQKMGYLICKRGHQALLPAGCAYRFTALETGVLLMQTMLGDLSVQKWSEICYQ
jgi:hypothetical protein